MAERATAGATEIAVQTKPGEPEARGQALFDMANVRVKIAPGARVRASEMATLALRPKVRLVRGRLDQADLDLLTRWIEQNREVLIKYWDGDIEYTEDAIAALCPIGPEE